MVATRGRRLGELQRRTKWRANLRNKKETANEHLAQTLLCKLLLSPTEPLKKTVPEKWVTIKRAVEQTNTTHSWRTWFGDKPDLSVCDIHFLKFYFTISPHTNETNTLTKELFWSETKLLFKYSIPISSSVSVHIWIERQKGAKIWRPFVLRVFIFYKLF